MKIPYNFLKIIFVALIFTSVPSHVLCSDSVQVEYNPVTTNLNVKAEDAKLEGILALVSHKTGVWVRIDPSIEKRITIDLNDIPLESMLLQLSRGLSHSMFYESLDNGSGLRLVGIEIVSNEAVPERRLRSYGRDMATAEFTPVAGEAGLDKNAAEFTPVAGEAGLYGNAGDKSPVDSDTEQPTNTTDERIVSPMGVTTTGNYAKGIFGTTQ